MRTVSGLVPTWSLILGVSGGAALIVLTVITPAFWAAVAAYHALLLWLVLKDAWRLLRVTLEASRTVPSPAWMGEAQTVRVALTCSLASGLQAAVADHASDELAARPKVVEGRFGDDGRLTVAYTIRPTRRGSYRIPALDVRVWQRRGWWVRQVRLPVADEVAVHPDVLAIRRFQAVAHRGLRDWSGRRRARLPGAATSAAGLREYLPGDDVRRINWKASARRDRPIATEFESERGQQLVLALDCGRLMTAPAGPLTKLDWAINAALLLTWVAQARGDRVGLVAFNERVTTFLPPRRGSAQFQAIGDALYRLPGSYAEPEYADGLAFLTLRVPARSLVVLLTDVLEAEASGDLVAHALRLGRRHLVLLAAIADRDLRAAVMRPIESAADAYRWAAGEEVLASRETALETLRRGGVHTLDVEAGILSPALVDRYLELKDRALI